MLTSKRLRGTWQDPGPPMGLHCDDMQCLETLSRLAHLAELDLDARGVLEPDVLDHKLLAHEELVAQLVAPPAQSLLVSELLDSC